MYANVAHTVCAATTYSKQPHASNQGAETSPCLHALKALTWRLMTSLSGDSRMSLGTADTCNKGKQ